MTRVLGIVYQRDAGAGVFADAIADVGAALERWFPAEDTQPPANPFGYDAVMAFGGAMHPDQGHEHPWLPTQKAVLAELIEREVPVLGVCLGAELVAEAAGATVGRAATPEIGWYAVATTPEAATDPLLAPLAPRFEAFEWHSYEFGLPPDATPLAHSDSCLQAFRIGDTAWGIQFHAEVTRDDLESWIDDYRSDPDALKLNLDPERLRSDSIRRMESWSRLGRDLCRRFVATSG